MARSARSLATPLLLAALVSGCEREGAPGPASPGAEPAGAASPGARPELVEALREAQAAPRHPSDGGGRAWLEPSEGDSEHAVAGLPGRFRLIYEVGPEGVASGGWIYFQVSPFWDWSTPQVEVPEAPGYTRVEGPDDADLEARTLDQQLLGIEVTGRPLAEGERIRILYGAGSAGASADRYRERDSRFWFAVDGDGDGVRAFLPDSPGIEVLPRGPAQLVVTLPTLARPGESVRVTLAVLDAAGNTGLPVEGEVTFGELPPGLEMPARVALTAEDAGRKTLLARATQPGVIRLEAEGPAGLVGRSNPLLVSETGQRIFWGDLHGHSNFSDGTGLPEDYFAYARDVAALDVVALTDHDHWGVLSLDEHPKLWEEIRKQTRRFHEPGRFVTLLGYEWTSWLHGHRHVLYFDDEGEIYSSLDPDYESPLSLWRALADRPALTFAHHSAGGPIATNWGIPPDPRLEPVTEIVSVHGSSEALDSPAVIYSPVRGNFVRDTLDRGYRLGFIGSGDSHDGHPGLAHLAAPTGGLAAIVSEELTREALLEALRARRVYATNGARILLRTALGIHPMGSSVPAPEAGLTEQLFVRVVGTAPLDRVELVRSGSVVDALLAEGRLEVAIQREVADLRPGEYLYVRAIQEDGRAAWSSPIFLVDDAS